MNLVILGLRRSGTTAFWGLWRQDPRVTCFNEPFNPKLSRMGDPAWSGPRFTAREFDALYRRDPAAFWHHYAPVDRHAELLDGLSDQQARWYQWLRGSAEHTCFDITRCHYKLDSLHALDPSAVVVHLYRPPANWVTSVVQPSTTHLARHARARTRLYHTVRLRMLGLQFQRSFWEARDAHQFKGFGELIGTHPRTFFGTRLAEAGMDPEVVYAMPDVGRLLAFWKVHYDRVERDGPRLFGDRFLSVNFNDVCRDPLAVVRDVCDRAGWEVPAVDPKGIHPPPPPAEAGDPRWAAYAERLGLPALS